MLAVRRPCSVSRLSASPPPAQVVTSAGFEGFSLCEVALFLRLIYHPADTTPANLARLQDSLSAVARLAHKFDIQPLLAAIEQQLLQPAAASGSSTNSMTALLGWLQLAEELHMDNLLATKVREAGLLLLKSLQSSPAGFASFTATAQMPELGLRASRLVLNAVLTSARMAGKDTLDTLVAYLSSPKTISGWSDSELGSSGELIWEVPLSDFSSSKNVQASPQFTAGGLLWKVELYPQGDCEKAAGHLSIYLNLAGTSSRPSSAVLKATYSLELVNKDISKSTVFTETAGDVFKMGDSWGWRKFIRASMLQSPDSSCMTASQGSRPGWCCEAGLLTLAGLAR